VKGTCPCGGVTVTVAARPEYLNACNCTLCWRLGTLWGYYNPAEVTIEGQTKAFQRSDIEVWLDTNFCPTCSAVVSWTAVRELSEPKMGLNMRLFDPEALEGLPVRFPDNRGWDDESERPPPRRDNVTFTSQGPF